MNIVYSILGWITLIASFFVDSKEKALAAIILAMMLFIASYITGRLNDIEKKIDGRK